MTLDFGFFVVGVIVAAIIIMGFVVFINNKASETNRAFLMLALMTAAWSLTNYLSYQFSDPIVVIWLIRAAIFFAVLYAYYVFHLCYVFPKEEVDFPKRYIFALLPLVVATAFLNLTPFVFEKIVSFNIQGQVSEIQNGPAIALFGIMVLFLNAGGLWLLTRKAIRAAKGEKRPYILVLLGLLITLLLIIVFNFIFPAFLNNSRYVSLGAFFIFPFISFTAYAIIKHRFLNIKVISTEIITFILSTVVLFEVILSRDVLTIVYRSSVFLLVLSAGLLLIKSVRKEVESREKLAKLAESLEKANLRLKELDRQKTDFLSIASHQLRTPLSIIKGYVELIRDGTYGKIAKGVEEVLEKMDKSNERLVVLIDEFLDVTRIEQGRTKFNYEMNDIVALITDRVTELQAKANEKDIQVIWEPGKDKQELWIDKDKINHVVFNFVDNAIKYSPEKTKVDVSLSDEQGGLAFRVIDQGIGFEKQDQASFFQKFYRGQNVKGKNVTGTGLGIYICRKFIESHGGRVWAESAGKGKGSEFGFWIPIKKKGTKTKQSA